MNKQLIALFLIVALFSLTAAETLLAENNDDWKDLYAKLLHDNESIYSFGLFDIDKDGTPELLCVIGEDNRALAQKISIYTIENKMPKIYFEIDISHLNQILETALSNFAFAAPANQDEIGIYYSVKDWWSGGALSIYKVMPTAEGIMSFNIANILSDFIFTDDEKHTGFYTDKYLLDGKEVTRDDIYNKIGTALPLFFLRDYNITAELSPLAQYNIETIINSGNNDNNEEVFLGKSNPMILFSHMQKFSTINQAIGAYIGYPNGLYDVKLFSAENYIEDTYLLMYNGSFIPRIDIHEIESKIYLPLKKVYELMGSDITLPDSEKALRIIDGLIYAPLDFFTENCIADIKTSNLFMNANLYIITFDVGYSHLVANSIQHAKQSIEHVLAGYYITRIENDNTVTQTRLQNTISHETEIGPYYIFYVENYEQLKIFVNKYSGEMYSISGVSFFNIIPGLPHFNFYTGG